jgi:hypothetical protein
MRPKRPFVTSCTEVVAGSIVLAHNGIRKYQHPMYEDIVNPIKASHLSPYICILATCGRKIFLGPPVWTLDALNISQICY